MPSAALTRWQIDRMTRLAHSDMHCAGLFAPLAAPGMTPPLAQESLQGYVMLISGHFQGFCRDLYTECAQLCAAAVPAAMQTTIQAQFLAELALDRGNPTNTSIRKDFERFSFLLDLGGEDPLNPQRLTHLGHLNYWRNHVAHQRSSPPPAGVPAVLALGVVQSWRASCDGLATSLDAIMKRELTRILGADPW